MEKQRETTMVGGALLAVQVASGCLLAAPVAVDFYLAGAYSFAIASGRGSPTLGMISWEVHTFGAALSVAVGALGGILVWAQALVAWDLHRRWLAFLARREEWHARHPRVTTTAMPLPTVARRSW